jgi:hypothetical protein
MMIMHQAVIMVEIFILMARRLAAGGALGRLALLVGPAAGVHAIGR